MTFLETMLAILVTFLAIIGVGWVYILEQATKRDLQTLERRIRGLEASQLTAKQRKELDNQLYWREHG